MCSNCLGLCPSLMQCYAYFYLMRGLMCIKIIGESEFNQVVFLSVDTNNSWKSLDINKEDLEKTVKQLIDVATELNTMLCVQETICKM